MEEGFCGDDPRFAIGVWLEALVRVTRLACAIGVHTAGMTVAGRRPPVRGGHPPDRPGRAVRGPPGHLRPDLRPVHLGQAADHGPAGAGPQAVGRRFQPAPLPHRPARPGLAAARPARHRPRPRLTRSPLRAASPLADRAASPSPHARPAPSPTAWLNHSRAPVRIVIQPCGAALPAGREAHCDVEAAAGPGPGGQRGVVGARDGRRDGQAEAVPAGLAGSPACRAAGTAGTGGPPRRAGSPARCSGPRCWPARRPRRCEPPPGRRPRCAAARCPTRLLTRLSARPRVAGRGRRVEHRGQLDGRARACPGAGRDDLRGDARPGRMAPAARCRARCWPG